MASTTTTETYRLVGESWPSKFHCFDNCNCARDLPLCCYASFCGTYAWAELMFRLEQPAVCCPNSAVINAVGCQATVAAVNWLLMSIHPCCTIPAASLAAYVQQDARRAIGNKGLPTDACGGPFCAHLCCAPCAVYQELVYAKHVLRKEPECCCYLKTTECVKNHCSDKHCLAPAPGDYNRVAVEGIVLAQPTAVVKPDSKVVALASDLPAPTAK